MFRIATPTEKSMLLTPFMLLLRPNATQSASRDNVEKVKQGVESSNIILSMLTARDMPKKVRALKL